MKLPINAPTTKQLLYYINDFSLQHNAKVLCFSTRKLKHIPLSDYRELIRLFQFENEQEKERVKLVLRDVKMMLTLSGIDDDAVREDWRRDCVFLKAIAVIA